MPQLNGVAGDVCGVSLKGICASWAPLTCRPAGIRIRLTIAVSAGGTETNGIWLLVREGVARVVVHLSSLASLLQ